MTTTTRIRTEYELLLALQELEPAGELSVEFGGLHLDVTRGDDNTVTATWTSDVQTVGNLDAPANLDGFLRVVNTAKTLNAFRQAFLRDEYAREADEEWDA